MYIWIGFISLIIIFLALDLGVFHKTSHVIGTKEAFRWTGVWVTISLLFSLVIYKMYESGFAPNENELSGTNAMLKYLTGYIVELSLSMDNIFVIAMIFAYFNVPRMNQHRVLFWGIIGAIFFRILMIFAGVVLIKKFVWMTFVFGGLLLYSAYKMLRAHNVDIDPANNPMVNLVRRFFPVSKHFEGEKFFVRRKHIVAATPLFIALLVVETTDILFAIDSIPAILGITTDPFLVFSSNIFAILGLRSMYFVLASMLDRFGYLKYSLVFILAFVGVKMILSHYVHLPEWVSLAVIFGALALGIITSLYSTAGKEASQSEESDK